MSKFAWTVGDCLTGTVITWLNVCVIFQLCKASFLIAIMIFFVLVTVPNNSYRF